MKRRAALAMVALAMAGGCRGSSGHPQALRALASGKDLILVRPQATSSDWMLWGRFEATREEVRGEQDRSLQDLPVTMISAQEAQAWCHRHGLRLPTEAEWRRMPVEGGGGNLETVPPQDRNGLELRLGHPLPVGVFERGRTGLGLYDIYGNVREMSLLADGRLRAYGGSYAARDANRDPRQQLEMEATSRAEDVGFRYVAAAIPYFREVVLPQWSALTAEERQQVQAWWESWRPEYRRAFARRLRSEGFDESLVAALEALPVASER